MYFKTLPGIISQLMAFEAGASQMRQCGRPIQIEYSKVEGKRREILPLKLARGWGLNVEGIQRFSGRWNAPLTFFRVTAREGVFFVSEAWDSTPERISQITDCMAFCSENGAKAQMPIPTKDGRRFYGLSNVFLFVSRFPDSRHFGGTREELLEVAVRLAELDLALARFPGKEEYMRRRNSLWHGSREAVAYLTSIRSLRRWNRLGPDLKEDFDHLIEKAGTGCPHIVQGLPRQVIHRNAHLRTVLFQEQGNNLLAFLDFDAMHFSQRIRGLAFAMHMFCRGASGNILSSSEAAEAARRNAREFVLAYNEVNPLTDDEFRSIGLMLCEEQVRRAFRSVREYYFNQRSERSAGLGNRLHFLKEAEVFASLF